MDYDRDGHLDLVVANYVQWSPETDIYCAPDGKTKSYCTPEAYKGTSVRLWHNRGDGTFEDATQKAGLYDPTSKSLGITILDTKQDGWPDIFVADGYIEDSIERVQPRVRYAEPPHLFRNLGNGRFEEVTASAGPAFAAPRVARGAAYGDFHNDGALDLIVSMNGGRALLFRNTGITNHSLRIKLIGTKSNRDGIGALVRVTADGDTQSKMLSSGSGYLSSYELVLTFGLGTHSKADAIEVRWPSGQVDRLAGVLADEIIFVTEQHGLTGAKPLTKR